MVKTWPLAAASFAAGIVLAYYHIWILNVLVIIALFLSVLMCKRFYRQAFLCLLVLLGGLFYAGLSIRDIPHDLPVVQGTSRTGTVQDFPSTDGDKTTFILKTVYSSPWEKKIRVVCYFPANFSRGDTVTIRGNLKPPRRPGNPGEFNYPLYLSHSGIYYNMTVKKPSDLSLVSQQQGLLRLVDDFRRQGEKIIKQTLPDNEAAILLGMLLGSREGIDEQQYEDFQKTGIIHLFSVSGLHVGFLLLLMGWISSLLSLSNRSRFWVGTITLLIYGTMIAWPVSVMRSVMMGIIGLLAYYSGRENSLLNAWAIAGIITLIINPAALFTISFQLTFIATWGLIYIFPRLRTAPPFKGRAWDLIALPLAAELAVLPLVAYYFNILTPVSILTNILVAYFSGAAVILGFLSLLLANLLPGLTGLFLYPAGLFIELILFITKWVQILPYAYIWVATPPVIIIILYYTGILSGLLGITQNGKNKWSGFAAGLVLFFLIGLLLPGSVYNRGWLEVDFIDVGQGDAILLKTPQGKFMLIDGGGNTFYDVGKTTVLPYLHRRGIRELVLLVNTHPDNDHLQGVERVAEEISVKNLALPKSLLDCREYSTLRKTAVNNRIPIVGLEAGQTVNIEPGLSIKVLHPGGETYVKNNNNNQSVVLKVSYGAFSMLLTGDIEAEAMESILAREPFAATTVVKVPHHGSQGSLLPEFYRQSLPRYAIISVGADNLFGHPHPNVLAALQQENIKILRTDQDGAVIFLSDGERISVKSSGVKGIVRDL